MRAGWVGADTCSPSATPSPRFESVVNVSAGRARCATAGAARQPGVGDAVGRRSETPGRRRRHAGYRAGRRGDEKNTLGGRRSRSAVPHRAAMRPLTGSAAPGGPVGIECPQLLGPWLAKHRSADPVCHHCAYYRGRTASLHELRRRRSVRACGPWFERRTKRPLGLFPRPRSRS